VNKEEAQDGKTTWDAFNNSSKIGLSAKASKRLDDELAIRYFKEWLNAKYFLVIISDDDIDEYLTTVLKLK
jgi:hypothetical protein